MRDNRPGSRLMDIRVHPSAWAIWPTTAVTWLAFAQVLTVQALSLWVVGGSIVTAMSVITVNRAGRRVLAIGSLVGFTLLIPFLAEMLAGNTSGPVTRATFMSCGLAGAMALMLDTRYPLAILPVSILLLGGALALGAAAHVLWITGVWSVAAFVTVAMLGPYRREHVGDRRRLVPFAVMLLLTSLVAVAAVALIAPMMIDPWTIPGSGQVAVPLEQEHTLTPTPEPTDISNATHPPSVTASPTSPTQSSAVETSPAVTQSPAVSPAVPTPRMTPVSPITPVIADEGSPLIRLLMQIVLLLLLLLLLVLLALVVWPVWIAYRWRKMRRRLEGGSPRQRAIGAWTWLRLRRQLHDAPLPVNVSPDVAVAWARDAGEPDVLEVARIVSAVAFDPHAVVDVRAADVAWEAALRAGASPRSAALRLRWRWSARTPEWARRRLPTEALTRSTAVPT